MLCCFCKRGASHERPLCPRKGMAVSLFDVFFPHAPLAGRRTSRNKTIVPFMGTFSAFLGLLTFCCIDAQNFSMLMMQFERLSAKLQRLH